MLPANFAALMPAPRRHYAEGAAHDAVHRDFAGFNTALLSQRVLKSIGRPAPTAYLFDGAELESILSLKRHRRNTICLFCSRKMKHEEMCLHMIFSLSLAPPGTPRRRTTANAKQEVAQHAPSLALSRIRAITI